MTDTVSNSQLRLWAKAMSDTTNNENASESSSGNPNGDQSSKALGQIEPVTVVVAPEDVSQNDTGREQQ